MNTVLFCFANQKGGVAKSTLTALFASYLFSRTDYQIAVIDADDIQSTLKKWRATDLANGLKEEEAYDLYKIESSKFPETYRTKIYGNYDFVLLDMPGTLKQDGVVQSLIPVDVIVSPMNLTQADIDATISFLAEYKKVDDYRISKGVEPAVKSLLFSKLDRRTNAAKNLEEFRLASAWPIINAVFPYRPSAYGTNARTFMDESSWEKELDPMFEEILIILKKAHSDL